MAQVEGTVVKVGDVVGFKSDVEQAGEIVEINGKRLKLKSIYDEGFDGDYISGNDFTVVDASECWID